MQYIKDWKQVESRRKWLLEYFAFHARKNRTHSKYQVGQRDNHPIELYSLKVIKQKLAYIHTNPVVDTIVASPEHYLYSSASNYLTGEGVLEVSVLEEVWSDIS